MISTHFTALADIGDACLQAPSGRRYVTLDLCSIAESGKWTNELVIMKHEIGATHVGYADQLIRRSNIHDLESIDSDPTAGIFAPFRSLSAAVVVLSLRQAIGSDSMS